MQLPVELVVVAPLQRALETAVAAFGGHVFSGRNARGPQDGTTVGGGSGGTVLHVPEEPPLLMAAQDGVEGKCVAHSGVSSRGCPPFIAHELCRVGGCGRGQVG